MVKAKLQLERQDERRLAQLRGELGCFLQSGEIREPSKVQTQGSISSHLEEEEKEGGQKRRRRRRRVMFYFYF